MCTDAERTNDESRDGGGLSDSAFILHPSSFSAKEARIIDTFPFEVLHRDTTTEARLGRMTTPHGVVETPVFMPVGTQGTVKAMTAEALENLGARIILGNTYHLMLRPGDEAVAELGGLHGFAGWNRALLTDSGGYQVFSLTALRKLDEEGVEFRSHIDGSRHRLSPERSMQVQARLGADIVMAFDECPPHPIDEQGARKSMELTLRWAERSARAFESEQSDRERRGLANQALFGIVQGSTYDALRLECIDRLVEIGFPGYAIGGLSVGESKDEMYHVTELVAPRLPRDKPRYLMGVGTPEDLLESVARGVDMFDCVLPTRNARNGHIFTSRGVLRIKNSRFSRDERPLDPACKCPTCARHSRAYLRHLFLTGEILFSILATAHNLYFYLDTMGSVRQAIALDRFAAFRTDFLTELLRGPE
jgi:queuine tRNA-ribosyltransferase